MFCDMNKEERRFYMIACLGFLKQIKKYGGPHGLAAAYGKKANEERFRKLWKNRHNETFDFNA